MNTPIQKIFRRGQVWHWKDPEYLEKSKGIKVPDMDAMYRYSRYVIVVQDPKTCSRKSILVVPCSSTNNTIHDVGMEIEHLYFSKRCYAKCQSIFPTDPRCLDYYVCDIDEATIAVIEGELMKMLFPSVISTTTPNDLKELFGVNTINMTTTRGQAPYNELRHDLTLFFRRHVHYTNNMEDRLTIQDIFTAYEKFCVREGYAVEDNLAYFTDTVIHMMNVKLAAKQKSCRWARDSIITNMAFRGITLVNTDELEYIDMVFDGDAAGIFADAEPTDSTTAAAAAEDSVPENNEDDEIPDNDQGDDIGEFEIPSEIIELTDEERHVPGGPWTDTMKKTYIGIVEKFGIEAAGRFYGLSAHSARRYLSNFKHDLGANRNSSMDRWTTDKKQEFLAFYEKNGSKKAAKKYGLTVHGTCCKASLIRKEFGMLPKNQREKAKTE